VIINHIAKAEPNQTLNWLLSLKSSVLAFLQSLKGDRLGFYHYSASGDLLPEHLGWGLGNTVFAVKILYTLNQLKNIEPTERQGLIDFILEFEKEDGVISDPHIHKLDLPRVLNFVRRREIKALITNSWRREIERAETRQAVSALRLLETKPHAPFARIPRREKELHTFLNSLNWKSPWGAGSHVSHILFFYERMKEAGQISADHFNHLVEQTLAFVQTLQNSSDGAWYRENPGLKERVNGAMKIISGMLAVHRLSFAVPEKLIDLCLTAAADEEACDHFNVIYVLKYASQLAEHTYRFSDIQAFAQRRLDLYRQHFFLAHGGFSSLKSKSNEVYYGKRITRGLPEPDIHGTCMFLWGISIIAQILGIDQELGFREFET
jgi:hypothetical protein